MMNWKSKFYKIGWLAAVLEACSDTSTAPTTISQASSTTMSATTSLAATNPTSSLTTPISTTIPTTNSNPTTPTTTQPPVTTTPTTTQLQSTIRPAPVTTSSPNTTLSNTQTTATTAPASAIPTTKVAPTTTIVSGKISHRQLLGAGQGRAFGFGEDGRLYFYAKISGRVGTYTLNPVDNAAQLQFLTSSLGLFALDLSLVAVSDRISNLTTIEQVANGAKKVTLQNRASSTLISPDKTQIAYLLRGLNQDGPEAPQYFELWVGNIDGSGLRKIWDLREGANLSWFSNSHSLLLTARDATNTRFGLWTVDVGAAPGQNAKLIVESKGLIQARLSSDETRVAYVIVFQGQQNSGVWLADSDGSNKRKFDWTGGFRWSATNELLYIPVRANNEPANTLWSYAASSNQAQRLTDPAAIPLSVMGDEWQLAPDAKSLVYRNAKDNALWYLRFR